MAHSTDARFSTFNNPAGDVINNYYPSAHETRPSTQPLSSLSFNEAPIGLLSSHFTGREKELNHIEQVLSVGCGSTLTRYVVYGMQGMGKTQLALQYAKRSFDRQEYSLIFWISGATVEKLNQGIAEVLDLISHPDRNHPEQSTKLTSARRWLEEPHTTDSIRWLLVLDNVAPEVVDFLRHHLPHRNTNGKILLTTRTRVVAEAIATVAGQQHEILELHPPGLQDATNQLLKEAAIDASGSLTASATGAEALVTHFGCLPLAISQAASFAKQSFKTFDDLLSLYKGKYKHEVSFNPLNHGL